MQNQDILHNPLDFQSLFYGQVKNDVSNSTYRPIINLILRLVWIGITKTRFALLSNKIQPALGFLCLATYKSFLPIIHNTQLGYISASLILMRAHIEQISLLGYLLEHTDQIPRYVHGEDLLKCSLKWAKTNTVENWMVLYNIYSKIAHAMLENTSTSVMDESEIGELIQESLPLLNFKKDKLTEEILAGIMYSLIALDSYNEELIGIKLFDPKSIVQLINDIADLDDIRDFLYRFVEKHKQHFEHGLNS